jgi:SpoVK/Ycf46/Vps4 family AAA+-type ATPase
VVLDPWIIVYLLAKSEKATEEYFQKDAKGTPSQITFDEYNHAWKTGKLSENRKVK